MRKPFYRSKLHNRIIRISDDHRLYSQKPEFVPLKFLPKEQIIVQYYEYYGVYCITTFICYVGHMHTLKNIFILRDLLKTLF
jgi:hypothetical protein